MTLRQLLNVISVENTTFLLSQVWRNGPLAFERARNETQREERIDQIKQAAIACFDRTPYHEITLAQIAAQTVFTRANLYKYVGSKEEIYLLVTEDELAAWVADLSQAVATPLSAAAFAQTWAHMMASHHRLMKLLAILFPVLERNASYERLVAFKQAFAATSRQLFTLLARQFPSWSSHQCEHFVRLQTQFSLGAFEMADTTEAQRQALREADLPYEPSDFETSMTEFLQYTIDHVSTLATRK